MTKYYLPLIVLLGNMCACTQGSLTVDEPQSDVVKFRAREASRASVVSNASITDNSFSVYGDMVRTNGGSSTPGIVFNGTEVSYTGGSWNYAQKQYWFPGFSYSFVALYPADCQHLSDLTYENNRLAFKYTQPADYTQAVDLLTATHRRAYSAGNPHAVAFSFDHIMARLNFTAQVDPAAQNPVTIDRLALVNIVNNATYQITPASLGSSSETDDYVEGTWTLPEDEKSTLFERTEGVIVAPGEIFSFFPADSDPLIIIPQLVTNDIRVEITYHHGDDVTNTVEASARLFSIANSQHGGKWDMGFSYTYRFSLGANDFVIYSIPEVENWKSAEGGNYVITD